MDPELARRLEELSALHTAGKINDGEHKRERTRILGQTSALAAPATPSTVQLPPQTTAPVPPSTTVQLPPPTTAPVPPSTTVQLPPPTAAPVPPSTTTVQHPARLTQFVPLGAPPPPYGLPQLSVPVPADGPVSPPHTTRWALLAGAAALLLAIGVSVFVLVDGSSGNDPALPPLPPPRSAAQEQLDEQVRTDAAAVEKLVDRWVPQLLAERVGSADGKVAAGDADVVLGSYRAVAGQRPGVLLLSSAAFSSFEFTGFYVVVMPLPFATPAEALGWCATQQLGRDQCFAKRLSHTAGPAGSTSYQG